MFQNANTDNQIKPLIFKRKIRTITLNIFKVFLKYSLFFISIQTNDFIFLIKLFKRKAFATTKVKNFIIWYYIDQLADFLISSFPGPYRINKFPKVNHGLILTKQNDGLNQQREDQQIKDPFYFLLVISTIVRKTSRLFSQLFLS